MYIFTQTYGWTERIELILNCHVLEFQNLRIEKKYLTVCRCEKRFRINIIT